MNFLFCSSENSIFDIAFALEHMGHTVTVLDQIPFRIMDSGYTCPVEPVKTALQTGTYDYVISYNYIPLLSELCESFHILYIAWIYDSPMATLFHQSVLHSCNRIFLFDYALYKRLRFRNIPHIYYMPLAANTSRINMLSLSSEDKMQYSCDVSFVGSLYEQNIYNDVYPQLPSDIQYTLDDYLTRNLCCWDSVRPWPTLSSELTEQLLKMFPELYDSVQEYELPSNLYFGLLYISRKLAELERITVINTLTEISPVDLYTPHQHHAISGVNWHSPVDYYTQLGKVYHFSKINLNITIPSIETGIPLRVFDIMAHGGFVLSNYQQDMDLLFTPGKDLAVYHDLTELKEKAAYYLSHEEERLTIAMEGYHTINRYYSYEIQLNKILSICTQSTD